ncbi:RnfABCDGE type electron transport complex subunit D [Arsenicitalea aurantiaca]|uniref:RnfABCDGE type electron transport complex subunit D n=1 Tax=Arsenicitalea aurantiaca TaxID=1783274 RepID=UPI0013151F6E|nr:RnfABCDGE type electron transport complex subunit D [Arsenicitalea aurantiaca]
MIPLLPALARLAPPHGQLPALLGLALPMAFVLFAEGGGLLLRVGLLLAVIVGWQVLFARIRGQHFGLEGMTAAILVGLLVPPASPLYQLVLAISFGIVIGQLVFGGHGRNILHPSVVTLAFLIFSFAAEGYGQGPDLPLFALVPAFVLLLGSGQANWRILAGALFSLLGLSLLGIGDLPGLMGSGLFWLGLLYFAADPVASAATNPGRLAHGLLFGLLAGLFATAGSILSAIVFAALMAGIFAPLLDQGAITVNILRRSRRHG